MYTAKIPTRVADQGPAAASAWPPLALLAPCLQTQGPHCPQDTGVPHPLHLQPGAPTCQESWGLWPRPGQPASSSRAPPRGPWAFLLGVLVQGTAEMGGPLGRWQDTNPAATPLGAGCVPPPPGGEALRARSSRAPRTQNPHCPLKVQAQAWEEGDPWPSRQPCATAG